MRSDDMSKWKAKQILEEFGPNAPRPNLEDENAKYERWGGPRFSDPGEVQCVRSSRSFSLRSETLVSVIFLRSETLGAKIAKVSLRFQSLGVCARQPDLRLRLPIRSESLFHSEIP